MNNYLKHRKRSYNGYSFLKTLKSQGIEYDDYIAYVGNMSDEFQQSLSLTNKKPQFSETLKIKAIPETTKLVPPVFSAGQITKNVQQCRN